MRSRCRVWLLAATLIVAIGVVLPGQALAKEFFVDDVSVDAVVQPDGAMQVSETRQMRFDGDYSRVFWVLDKGGSQGIEVIGVSDSAGTVYKRIDDPSGIEDRTKRVPGTMYVTDTGNAVEVHVFHDAADSSRAFRLDYVVKGAATRWADTSELYWKLLGSGWEVPTARFRSKIVLPGPLTKEQVKAWAHGPLNGVVAIGDDGTVTLDVTDVPPQTFVEVHVAFPAESLSMASPSTESRLQKILDEEAGFANES
ncbi:MAG: DUF2207 domain-containing protein, partial [Actinobacteria bacterium]